MLKNCFIYTTVDDINYRKLIIKAIYKNKEVLLQVEITMSRLYDIVQNLLEDGLIDCDIIEFNTNKNIIKSYYTEHIDLRYFIAHKYYPNEYLAIMEKTERDISQLYFKFIDSLPKQFKPEEY
jgi:hypothetical protein